MVLLRHSLTPGVLLLIRPVCLTLMRTLVQYPCGPLCRNTMFTKAPQSAYTVPAQGKHETLAMSACISDRTATDSQAAPSVATTGC